VAAGQPYGGRERTVGRWGLGWSDRHQKKKEVLSPLLLPPVPVALREHDPAIIGQREAAPTLIPVVLCVFNLGTIPLSDALLIAPLPDCEFDLAALICDQPDLTDSQIVRPPHLDYFAADAYLIAQHIRHFADRNDYGRHLLHRGERVEHRLSELLTLHNLVGE